MGLCKNIRPPLSCSLAGLRLAFIPLPIKGPLPPTFRFLSSSLLGCTRGTDGNLLEAELMATAKQAGV